MSCRRCHLLPSDPGSTSPSPVGGLISLCEHTMLPDQMQVSPVLAQPYSLVLSSDVMLCVVAFACNLSSTATAKQKPPT